MSEPEVDYVQMAMGFIPMVVIFGLQALKLDYEDPTIIWAFRGFYATSLLVYLGICYLVYTNILKNTSLNKKMYYAEKFTPSEKQTEQQNYDNLSEQEKKKTSPPGDYYMIEETIQEYDSKKAMALMKSTIQGTAITIIIHWYFGFMPPLVIQGISMFTKLYQDKLMQIHIFGNTQITRPFREPAGFMDKMQGKDPIAEIETYEREQKKKSKKSQ